MDVRAESKRVAAAELPRLRSSDPPTGPAIGGTLRHMVPIIAGGTPPIAHFSQVIGPIEADRSRVQTHLSRVERELRGADVAHLRDEQISARSKALDVLHDYWHMTLAADFEDEVLNELWVARVEPVSSLMQLRAWVVAPKGRDPQLIHARLSSVAALLRAEVASAIHRKQVPSLSFAICAPEEES
jgi:hypothetical protein